MNGIKAGMTGKEADALTRDYITEHGYGQYFGHSTGHGVGLEVHEGPSLSVKSTDVLQPGMIVTVEPGIYIPDLGAFVLKMIRSSQQKVMRHYRTHQKSSLFYKM